MNSKILTMFSSEFGDWINSELNKKGWKQADLVRRGVDSGYLSKVINGTRPPGLNFLIQLSDALNVRREVVFQAAGVLERNPKEDYLTQEAEYLLSQLPDDKKQQAVNFIRFLAGEGDQTNLAPRSLEKPEPDSP